MKRIGKLVVATVVLFAPMVAGADPIILGPQYSIDDGQSENGLGVSPGSSQTWANQFVVEPGGEVITEILIAWGSVQNGLAATVWLWDDIDNDGTPNDLAILMMLDVITANARPDRHSSIFNTYDIPDTPVSGSFFVGVSFQSALEHNVAAWDNSSQQGRSWLITSFFADWILLDDLLGPGPGNDSGNWLVRANSRSTVSVPEPGTLALLGIGLFGMGLTARRNKVESR